jgi:hypothetical protein
VMATCEKASRRSYLLNSNAAVGALFAKPSGLHSPEAAP